jgi:hypothetical protein
MVPFDFNKYSSALKQGLRDILHKSEANYTFKTSNAYKQTLKATLESILLQKEQFADFVIRKQAEIDTMDPGIIKNKMQEHLDQVAKLTYEHFSKLTAKYKPRWNDSNY